MLVGCSDRRRSNTEVAELFNKDREQVSRSTVSKTLGRFNETGNVRNRQRTGRSKSIAKDENFFNIMSDVTKNTKTSVLQLALNHKMNRGSVQKILKREKYHTYKINLLQELSEDDFDRRIEFC